MEKTSPEYIFAVEPVDTRQSTSEGDSSTPRKVAESGSAVLWLECERTGDIYYRLMREWIESKQAATKLKTCYAAALEYRTSLDRFIAHPEESNARNLRTAIEYRSLLERSIALIAPRETWPQSPARLRHQLHTSLTD